MQVRIHKLARATPVVRQEIKESKLSCKALASKYKLTLKTIYKWKRRESTQDKSHTRHNLLSRVSEREEAIISELRTKVGLSVDDITRVMQKCINPKLSRSSIYRAMKRCGVNRLPEADKNQPHWQPFETVTEYGHIHMDVKYLPKLEGIRSYLYVAIDRMTRYVYAEVLYNLEPKTAAGFVEKFTKHFPYKIKKIITDNGFEWTDRCAGGRSKPSGYQPVDEVCYQEQIKHALTRIRRPQTNGMVERFNRRINEAIAQRGKITDNSGKNTFHSHLERNSYIINFVEAYNRTALQCLNYRAPCSVLMDNHTEGNTEGGNLGLSFPRRREPIGYQYLIALFLLLSCSRTPINPDPTTNVQQTHAETGQGRDTPLHQAILAQTDLASLYPFLQPTSINQPNSEGNTPLHRAVIQDNLPLVGLLLSAKANIDAQNAAGRTPLHLAAKQGNLLTLHLLLIYQADIHAKDKEGHKPLNYIKEKQQTDELQQLLKRTPWDTIARERDPFVVAWLLAAEKNRTKDTQGWTPLHLAACLGQVEAIQDLIANKVDIEAKNSNGWTPLHLAAFLGQIEAIQALLDNKATTEAKDNQGYTPLHVATLAGRLEAVQLLIDHQAPVEATDYKGRTPYDIAESAAVKELLGSRMNLGKLVFNCDYDNIGKRIVSHLTPRQQGQLRQTYTEMGWNLLQKGDFHLQVTTDKLPHLQPHLHPRLYPHAQTSHCVCLTFEPIPADAVVRGAFEWEHIAKNKHLSIKNVVFKGKVEALESLRAALPTHLADHLIVPAEIIAQEEKILARQARKKARVAAHEASPSFKTSVEAEKPISLDEEDPAENPYVNDAFLIQPAKKSQKAASSSSEETKYSDSEEKQQTGTEDVPEEPPVPQKQSHKVTSSSSQEPQYSDSDREEQQIDTKEASEKTDVPLEPSPYQFQPTEKKVASSASDETQYSDSEGKQQVEAEAPLEKTDTSLEQSHYQFQPAEKAEAGEQKYSDDEGQNQDDQAAGTGQEQQPQVNQNETDDQGKAIVDPGNQLYNSFVGVKKLPAGKVTIGGYLAAGAFGKVYRGQWGNKAVALKQIDLEHASKKLYGTSYKRIQGSSYTHIPIGHEAIKEAMQWEVARLSTTNHPNLVQFYGLYQDGNEGDTYMVMEFCDGGTLQGALEKATVPWSQRWQWALQTSQALAYLHQEGVLHRDLKAENILLDKQARAKLADLGVAQVDALLQDQEAKILKAGLQDKRFIAPEVETDPTLSTQATDIYALGLVFWQIASGKEPRRIDDLVSYEKDDWRQGREREPIPTDCPESFKTLILECWAKEPNKRPTAQGVLAKLAALGPELDPYHHPLVIAAQKLEQIVHPKRKEGRAYIPPFVTQYSVDESIETYWNRIEAASPSVILADAGNQLPSPLVIPRNAGNQNPPLTLAETFKEFIESPNANTLLLLGEAGLGKTLTTYQWGDQLLEQWWAHMNTGTPAPAYFPIFIRPELPTWSHAHIKDAFQEVARKYNLPKGIQPLVFIDGYDELQNDEEPINLVEHLGLLGMGNTKLIVSCRPNIVEQSALKSRFSFNGALTTRHFLPFNLDQLLGYLQTELSWEEKVYQDYKNTLGGAESVRTVLRNPFVLQLFKQSWGTLSERPLGQLNRWQIYEGFIDHIIQENKTFLSKRVRKKLQGDYPHLLSSYQAFMSEIAWQSFQQKGITLSWEEAKKLSPWSELKQYAEEDAKDEFAQRQARQKALAEAEQGQVGRRSLLSEDDYVRLTQKKVGQAESELPLQLRGEGSEKRYEYSHKSLFEYGMAKRLLLLKNSPNIVKEAINLLNSRKIQEELEALQFWQEGWKEPGSEALIEPLFEIITASRDNETIQQASANSATLLAQAQVAFSGRALQGVRLPEADLSGAVLSYTCLAGAQLPRALLRGAYMGNTDLRGANLSDVDFGQYPSLKYEKAVLCLSYHPSGTQLAVGLVGGNIELYTQAEGAYRQLATLKGHTENVNSVAYRPDGQQLASGSDDNTVGLWDPSSKQLLAQLKGHSGVVWSVCYRPDGQQLASGSDDKTVGLWDGSSKQLLAQLKGHSGWVMSVCYRPDGQQLASGSDDNTVGLWDPATHQQLATLKGHSRVVMSVCYRPDGQQLASGSDDTTVGLWDPATHQQLATLKGHRGGVCSVCYRPDGQQLASGSDDTTVGLWDPATHQQLATLKGHRGGVCSVCYRPDGQQLASGSSDNSIFVWARQDTAGSLQETWQLIHRFENSANLAAPGALLKGATISINNRELLRQKGAIGDNYDQELNKAAQEGNPWIIQTLIQSKANLETKDEAGHTPLHIAAANGHTATVQALIQSNANLEVKDEAGHTPLHVAVQKAQVGAAHVLLQANASIDKNMIDDNIFLHKVVQECHTEAIQLLLQAAPNIDAADKDDRTPLHFAAEKGHTTIMETLLQTRANIEATDKDGRTPLHFAAQGGHISTVEALIQARVNMEATEKDGRTPLHFAAQNGNPRAVEALLQANANIEATEKDGRTPLHFAAQNGYTPTAVEALLQARANIEAIDKEGRTPLHFAAQNGNPRAMEVLIQASANIEATEKDGRTPLHFAAQNGYTPTAVEALLQARANIEAIDKEGRTPLHFAAQNGNSRAVKALLQASANIEATEKDGRTPLHFAAQNGYLSTAVEALLQARANIEATEKDGRTPLHFAAERGHTTTMEALLQARANIDATEKEGRTPLHIAAALKPNTRIKPIEVIQVLIQAGANIEATERNGCTPLHIAAALEIDQEGEAAQKESQIEVVQYLLSQGANKDVTNKEGKKPYDVAMSEEIKKLLG